eukprot:260142-Rhodomonas_salina.3
MQTSTSFSVWWYRSCSSSATFTLYPPDSIAFFNATVTRDTASKPWQTAYPRMLMLHGDYISPSTHRIAPVLIRKHHHGINLQPYSFSYQPDNVRSRRRFNFLTGTLSSQSRRANSAHFKTVHVLRNRHAPNLIKVVASAQSIKILSNNAQLHTFKQCTAPQLVRDGTVEPFKSSEPRGPAAL